MREQTLSQPQLSTDSSGPAAQEPGASAEESGASAATTGSTADAKIPFRPRKIRKVSSEGDPQQVSSPASTKKAANSRAPLLRVVSRPLSADSEIDNPLHHLRAADHLLARVIDAHDPPTLRCLHPLLLSVTPEASSQVVATVTASLQSRSTRSALPRRATARSPFPGPPLSTFHRRSTAPSGDPPPSLLPRPCLPPLCCHLPLSTERQPSDLRGFPRPQPPDPLPRVFISVGRSFSLCSDREMTTPHLISSLLTPVTKKARGVFLEPTHHPSPLPCSPCRANVKLQPPCRRSCCRAAVRVAVPSILLCIFSEPFPFAWISKPTSSFLHRS